MADHMASENIWMKGKLLSRAFLRYGKYLFMLTKYRFSRVLIFEIFWYNLKRMLLNSFKKAEL